MTSSSSVRPNAVDWSGLARTFLFFWYFSAVAHVLYLVSGATGFLPFRQGFIFSLLWLVPVLLFPTRTRSIALVIGLILWLSSLINLGYFAIYRQEFSQSVLFIIFDSNPEEASEYIDQYLVWWMFPALLIYSLGGYLLWRTLRPLSMPSRWRWVMSLLIIVGLFAAPVLKLVRKDALNSEGYTSALLNRMEPAVPWQFVIGYGRYQEQLVNMEALVRQNESIPPIANLKDARAGQPGTLVLLIGESTSSRHMGLYGYARNTNPELEALRSQLTIFPNIYAARPYTIEELQQVLTFADEEQPDLYLSRPSLMNIMKQAGYKTYWITNQQTLTQRNTMLTSFSKQMDEQVYLNNQRSQNSYSFDENVLEPLAEALRDPEPRKFIVVHLLGTHMSYKYRYPEAFDVFKDKSGLPDWVGDSQLSFINEYDNAVRYNDHVVASIIKLLDQAGGASMMTYFSDHGEDVFDTPDHSFIGRNEGAPTPPMYSVPFLIWSSPEWKAQNPRALAATTGRTYQLSHFIHTWADLAGLDFDGMDKSKSLVSGDFKERPILVGDPAFPETLIDLRSKLGKPLTQSK